MDRGGDSEGPDLNPLEANFSEHYIFLFLFYSLFYLCGAYSN